MIMAAGAPCHHGNQALLTSLAACLLLSIILHLGVSSVRVQTTTPRVEVFRGDQSAVLECRYNTLDDDSILSVNWYRKTIFDSDFRLIAQIPNNRSPVVVDLNMKKSSKLTYNRTGELAVVKLTFTNVQCLDDAHYQCEVRLYGERTPSRPSMRLVVYEKPYVPSISQAPMILHDNANAHFKCRAYMGKPRGRMLWIMTRNNGGRLEAVELAGISSRKKAVARCNRLGAEESRLQLSVTRNDVSLDCVVLQQAVSSYDPVTVKSRKILDVKYPVRDVRVDVYVNGRQFLPKREVSATVGDLVTLRCSSSGNPAPSYTWRFLSPSGSRLGAQPLTQGHKGNTLTLSNITTNQSGSYICISRNFLDTIEHSRTKVSKLFVTEGKRFETSSFLSASSRSKRVIFPKSVMHYVMIGGIVGSACIFVFFISLLFAHCTRKISPPVPQSTYQGVPVRRV